MPCQSTNDRDRAIVASRLRTSFASSAGLCAPASSSLRRRFAAAFPVLISINNSASRSTPSASRFFALRAVFAATCPLRQPLVQLRPAPPPRDVAHGDRDSLLVADQHDQLLASCHAGYFWSRVGEDFIT